MNLPFFLSRSCVCLGFLILASCFFALTANAGGIQYQFDAPFTNTDDPDPSGPAPWVTAIFQNGSPGNVSLTVTNTDLTTGEFVASLYFNLSSAYDPTYLKFTLVSSNGNFQPTIQTGESAFKSDGDGYYDILISLGNHAFSTGSFLTWDIIDTNFPDLDATNFIQLSSEGGGAGTYDAATKIQGLGGGGTSSTYLYPTEEAQTFPLPEPGTPAIVSTGAGLLVSARWWLRRKKSQLPLARK